MKRTNVLTISLLSLLLVLSGAGFSQSGAEYKTKIQALNKEMSRYMVEGNMDKVLSMYTQDAISMPSYEPMYDGLAAIRESSEHMKTSGMKYNSFELTTLKVVVGGNLINEIGTYKINATMPGMDKPIDDHGKYLTVWEKQKDGSLKVKIETWNTDVKMNEGMK